MTVTTENRRTTYAGNGVTTVFSTLWRFIANSEVVVRYTPSGGTETIWTEGVHYTLTGAGNDSGGDVTAILTTPAASSSLVIERVVPLTQLTNFRTLGSFSPLIHENAFDEVVFITQQLEDRISDLESAGAPGSVVAGDALEFSGTTLHVRPDSSLRILSDQIGANYLGGAGAAIGSGAGAAGVSAYPARSDHTHQVTSSTAPVNVTKSAASAGVGAFLSKNDHKHDVSTGVPVSIGSANAEGTGTALTRQDHVHAHGNQNGSSDHAVASAINNGFMSAADKIALDALVGESPLLTFDVYTNSATPDASSIWQTVSNTTELVEVTVAAKMFNNAQAATYKLIRGFYNHDGTVFAIAASTVVSSAEVTAGWDCAVAVSGAAGIAVTVTGAAASNVQWKITVKRTISTATH